MQHISSERIRWKEALDRESPLVLPVAHDALSAWIIARTGFAALQIGGSPSKDRAMECQTSTSRTTRSVTPP
jgi:2-methylisocitrate lyase-like PEP mutase family enzyme